MTTPERIFDELATSASRISRSAAWCRDKVEKNEPLAFLAAVKALRKDMKEVEDKLATARHYLYEHNLAVENE